MAASGEAAPAQGEQQQEAIQLTSLSIEQLDMMRKQLDGVSARDCCGLLSASLSGNGS